MAPGLTDKQTDELWPGGYRYYRDADHFPLGMDCVLLSAFVRLRRGMRVLDLGTGCGYIPLMLLGWQPELRIDAVELIPTAAGLARANAALNGLEDRINVIEGDLRSVSGLVECGAYDLAVCNPPYFSPGSGRESSRENEKIARSAGCTVREVCAAASYALKNGGSFGVCWRTERMAELFASLNGAGLEPKILRLCANTAGSAPFLMLLQARKQGRGGLTVMPELAVREQNGAYTREIMRMYHRDAEGG